MLNKPVMKKLKNDSLFIHGSVIHEKHAEIETLFTNLILNGIIDEDFINQKRADVLGISFTEALVALAGTQHEKV
jgi:hypothetical protein